MLNIPPDKVAHPTEAQQPRAQIMQLPPYMTVKRTCEVTADSRASVYKKIAAGRYRAVKDGSKTLIETASVLEDLARLPVFAEAKALSPTKRGKRANTPPGGA
jgi:excisionase family DNA binding protein